MVPIYRLKVFFTQTKFGGITLKLLYFLSHEPHNKAPKEWL